MQIFFVAISLILLVIIILAGYLLLFHSYRYNSTANLDFDSDGIANIEDEDIDGDGIKNLLDNDADGDGIDNIEDIIQNARKMKGTMYDFTQGQFNNIGGKLGFLVCIDVPKIAYAEVGIYFEKLLREDVKVNGNLYNRENGINIPQSPFFYRRTRNLYRYCELNKKMIKSCKRPEPGDLIFYGRYHITMVSEVHEDGTYNEIETAPHTGFVVEHKNKVWRPRTVGRLLNYYADKEGGRQ